MFWHSDTCSYASKPNFCLNNDKLGRATHGSFTPSCVTIESRPYLVSLFDFITATFLHNKCTKRKMNFKLIISLKIQHNSNSTWNTALNHQHLWLKLLKTKITSPIKFICRILVSLLYTTIVKWIWGAQEHHQVKHEILT